MRLLPDSHAVYWWMRGSPRLSEPARALLENCALVSLDRVFDDTPVDRHW